MSASRKFLDLAEGRLQLEKRVRKNCLVPEPEKAETQRQVDTRKRKAIEEALAEGQLAQEGEDEEGQVIVNQKEPKKKKKKKKKKSMKLEVKRQKRSLAWYMIETGTSTCLSCGHDFGEAAQSNNVLRHFQKQHPRHLASLKEASDSGRDISQVVKSLKEISSRPKGALESFVVVRPRLTHKEGLLVKELALLRFLICTKVAPNALDDQSFADLQMEWGVKLESKNSILKLVPAMHEIAVAQREAVIRDSLGVAVSLDLWTSASKLKYLLLIYHCITPDWWLKHYVMDMIPMYGGAFATLIAAAVDERVEQHLGADQVLGGVVSDRGSDAKKARDKDLPYDSEDCFNHLLNSALGDVLGNCKLAVYHDVATIEYVISMFNSNHLQHFFTSLQEEAEEFDQVLAFVTRSATRWSGTHDALARYARLKPALMADQDDAEAMRQHLLQHFPSDLLPDVFQDAFFVRIEAYVATLAMYNSVVKAAQGLGKPTASQIPRWLCNLKSRLGQESMVIADQQLRQALLTALNARCGDYLTKPNNALKAACVDPSQSRFLSSYGVSAEVINNCWALIEEEVLDHVHHSGHFAMLEEQREESEHAAANLAAKLLRSMVEAADVDAAAEDPLAWYRTTNFPPPCHPALVAGAVLLAIPAGEAHCERAFSWAGGFITKLRTRMLASNLERNMVLYDLFKDGSFNWETFKSDFLASLRQTLSEGTTK